MHCPVIKIIPPLCTKIIVVHLCICFKVIHDRFNMPAKNTYQGHCLAIWLQQFLNYMQTGFTAHYFLIHLIINILNWMYQKTVKIGRNVMYVFLCAVEFKFLFLACHGLLLQNPNSSTDTAVVSLNVPKMKPIFM